MPGTPFIAPPGARQPEPWETNALNGLLAATEALMPSMVEAFFTPSPLFEGLERLGAKEKRMKEKQVTGGDQPGDLVWVGGVPIGVRMANGTVMVSDQSAPVDQVIVINTQYVDQATYPLTPWPDYSDGADTIAESDVPSEPQPAWDWKTSTTSFIVPKDCTHARTKVRAEEDDQGVIVLTKFCASMICDHIVWVRYVPPAEMARVLADDRFMEDAG